MSTGHPILRVRTKDNVFKFVSEPDEHGNFNISVQGFKGPDKVLIKKDVNFEDCLDFLNSFALMFGMMGFHIDHSL